MTAARDLQLAPHLRGISELLYDADSRLRQPAVNVFGGLGADSGGRSGGAHLGGFGEVLRWADSSVRRAVLVRSAQRRGAQTASLVCL